MAAGYAFGAIMLHPRRPPATPALPPDRLCPRRRHLVVIAGLLVVLPCRARQCSPPALFRFLTQQKYPASQLFLLMTLGPMIALLRSPSVCPPRSPVALSVFGRVPMFYYLLHIR